MSTLPAHQLGQAVIAEALRRAQVKPAEVSEVILGQVLTAGAGQNPARQAAVHAGLAEFLSFLVVINIFFGIFNLFPMLPLDGGHVAIAVYEKIRTGRRKVMYHADVAKLMPFTWLFLLFLVVLIVPALLTDILHPMANPFN